MKRSWKPTWNSKATRLENHQSTTGANFCTHKFRNKTWAWWQNIFIVLQRAVFMWVFSYHVETNTIWHENSIWIHQYYNNLSEHKLTKLGVSTQKKNKKEIQNNLCDAKSQQNNKHYEHYVT